MRRQIAHPKPLKLALAVQLVLRPTLLLEWHLAVWPMEIENIHLALLQRLEIRTAGTNNIRLAQAFW
jgi:hypothetical protein